MYDIFQVSICILILWNVVHVLSESEAEAGYRRTDPDWSRYTGGRRYTKAHLARPKKSQQKPKLFPGNKVFSKRISSGKKNPISSQYPAKPGQPLGLILNVGDQRKSFQKRPSPKKQIIKKSDNFKQKKFKKILKRKGLRGKVKLVRRKPILRPSKPQKTFRPKKGSSFSLPSDRVFNDFYPSGTIGHALLSPFKPQQSSQGSYKPITHKRPNKKPTGYKPPKKTQSYKPAKKPQQSYKPAPKPQQSYKPAKKPEGTYKRPAKKPQQSYKPVKESSYKPSKPVAEYKPVESVVDHYSQPESSYKPSEPIYKPVPDYKPPESSYKPSEPVYKPQPEYKPSYTPDVPKNVHKPQPSYEPSYEPEEVTSYKPPKVDYKQPEYEQQEVTSYKPPADVYKPEQQGFNDFPNFPMPDFSSFLKASFEPDFSFELPKLNSN